MKKRYPVLIAVTPIYKQLGKVYGSWMLMDYRFDKNEPRGNRGLAWVMLFGFFLFLLYIVYKLGGK